jgi:transposase
MYILGRMKPYSNDLRRALVAAYENNDYSQRTVAALFGVSLATVRNILRRKRKTGTPDASG